LTLGGIGRAARRGAIIIGGLYLESLGRVDTIVLDKTGTLTFGRPEVQTIIPTEGVSPEAVLEAAASAEVRSEHPLGQAIATHAWAQGRTILEPERFDCTPGRGITAVVGGATILVGNRALMMDCDVAMPATLVVGLEAASEIFVGSQSRHWRGRGRPVAGGQAGPD
jgi:P-type Cu+ transporter